MSDVPNSIVVQGRIDWDVWKRWSLANLTGGALGLLLPGLIVIISPLAGIIILAVFGALLVGVSVGISQARVLSAYRPEPERPPYFILWTSVTVFGGYLAFREIGIHLFLAYSDFQPLQLEEIFGRPLGLFTELLLLGVLQWVVLQHYVGRAWWWIPANIVSWGIGFFVGLFVAHLLLAQPIADSSIGLSALALFLGGTTVTLVYGVLSGFVVAWLLQQSKVANR